MSTIIRVAAEFVGDPKVPAGEDWKIVLDATLEDGRIKNQLCFGFAACTESGSTSRWPFILRPVAPGSREWVLDWGADSEPPQRTNVIEKDIRVGTLFTVWHDADEMIYRITQVNEL
jgi:hypothetical protein